MGQGPLYKPQYGGRHGQNYGNFNEEVALPQSTMTLDILDDMDPVMQLDALTYTATVTNTGAFPVYILGLSVTLPGASTYVGADKGGFDSIAQAAGIVSANYAGPLGAGLSVSCTIIVTTPGSAQTLTCSGTVTALNAPDAVDSETTAVIMVSKDATSGIRVPANATEWTNLRNAKTVAGTPFALYLDQEASGNLADSIGTLTLAYLATATYQATEPGWTRKGIEDADGATGRFFNQSVGVPNCATESMMIITYVDLLGLPAAGRVFAQFGGDNGNNNINWQQDIGAGTISLKVNTHQPIVPIPNTGRGGVVRPYTLQWDRANGQSNGYTDIDKLVQAYTSTDVTSNVTRLMMQFGGLNPNCRSLYYVSFRGVNAELTTTQIKALLRALGWTITWTP